MINGFEEETAPLTATELQMVPDFIAGFARHIGEENAVRSQVIIDHLRKYNLTGARVRKIVNFIRVNNLIKNLIATSKGYYIENDPDKLKKYVESLRQRAEAIQAVANSYSTKP